MGKTKISWATYTVNIVTGCSKPAAFPLAARNLWDDQNSYSTDGEGRITGCIDAFSDMMPGGKYQDVTKWTRPGTSPECIRCYAEALSLRRGWTAQPWQEENEDANVRMRPDRFKDFTKVPVKSVNLPPSERERFFVCSMGDIFHRAVSDEFLQHAFSIFGQYRHIYMLLTKRPERAAEFEPSGGWPANVWLGTTIGHPVTKWRAEYLRRSRAAVRFISAEPLLDSLMPLDLDGIDQVIVGGESGSGFRKMNMQWAREVQAACEKTKTAFFYKQDSAYQTEVRPWLVNTEGGFLEYHQYPGELTPARPILTGRDLTGKSSLPILA